MYRNYLTIAFRIFRLRPAYSLTNIFGLAIGIACCLVTYLLLHHELTFDQFHTKKDNIYKVVIDYKTDWGINHYSTVTYSVAPLVRQNLPEFDKVLELQGPYQNTVSFTNEAGNFQAFKEDYVLYASDLFFDMFDFEIIQGAAADALKEPGKVYLTEKSARKYFGSENPIGKSIQLQKDDEMAVVVGVVKNPPVNSSIPFDVLVSYETFKRRYPGIFRLDNTMTWACSVYLEFPDDHNQEALADKLTSTLRNYVPDDADKYTFKLQPLTDIHTNELYGNGTHYVVPSQLVIGLIALAILLIGTACLNFINLSTAQAVKRSKEVGIRKTIGGHRSQLVLQFMTETFLIVFIATFMAFTITQLLLSSLNGYLNSMIPYELSFNGSLVVFALILMVIVTLLAGFYPSMILAGYHPIDAIRNTLTGNKKSGSFLLRKSLITAQFVFSILLITVTVIISGQIRYVNTMDLGFNKQDIVHINLTSNIVSNNKVVLLRDALQNKSYVKGVSSTADTPIGGGFGWNSSFKLPQNDYEDGMSASVKFVDEGFIDTYQIKLLAGENLRPKTINDSTFHTLVNKRLLEKLNVSVEDAIGMQIDFNGNLYARIVGVTEDFNTFSLKSEMNPVILAYRPTYLNGLSVKLQGQELSEIRADLENTFKEFFPTEYFDYFLLEDEFKEAYQLENILYRIVTVFTILALIISIMGLYGLVSFMTARYAKMIGIRKVFGASTTSIIRIFLKEYLLMLLIAFLIASPVAYLIGQEFISEFAYQITIGPVYFLLSLLIISIVAGLTVGRQSYKAASKNPVTSLRYE
ncbi:MAG: ABC transporter permease [Bacteroidota bacterium]